MLSANKILKFSVLPIRSHLRPLPACDKIESTLLFLHHTENNEFTISARTHMIACNICDIKLFTKKLFIGETFDRFLLKEAEIVTFNTFSIDGRVHKSFYSEEERAEGQIEEYSTWKTLRPFCFSLIKGKKLPERFSIILKLPKAATEQFLTARKSQWLPEQVGGLFLNIHYENQHLSCVTGLSLNQFTLDKTLEREWDESIRTFLRKEELPFEE